MDLEPFRDLQGFLSNATSNINQIAKRVNSTGIIYKDDINDMKKQIEYFSKELRQIHSLLLNRTSGVIKFYGYYKNTSYKINL
ncbi:plasmid mobilization relaxosome protein MobC [Enterococcus faecalis]|nr:plasmid mobilization relaxosome protein MobC [Enterococcus avium]PJC88536.1 plasmid mobilization relaxosome protein MobC [Enterococcus faecalis]